MAEDRLLDHNYDGIEEFDNPLPQWWLILFYITIIFGVVYAVYMHFTDMGMDQYEKYEQELVEYRELMSSGAIDSSLVFFEGETFEADDSPTVMMKGKEVFDKNCVACHLADGGGLVGPNLTDEYWILGGGMNNIVNTIRNGGREGKGMIPWQGVLSKEEILAVSNYVLSLGGTTPASPKEPEGEIWTGETDGAEPVNEMEASEPETEVINEEQAVQ
jgi:cytochrome c oxidase cbb3-type subunit 3